MKVVAKNLPVEEIDNYTQMFHRIDKDKDGTLTLEELKEGLRINGHSVPETEIQMLLEAVSAYTISTSIPRSFHCCHVKKVVRIIGIMEARLK